MLTAAYRKAELTVAQNHRAEGTGENESYTPAKYIEAAREVMGGIDLDPANLTRRSFSPVSIMVWRRHDGHQPSR